MVFYLALEEFYHKRITARDSFSKSLDDRVEQAFQKKKQGLEKKREEMLIRWGELSYNDDGTRGVFIPLDRLQEIDNSINKQSEKVKQDLTRSLRERVAVEYSKTIFNELVSATKEIIAAQHDSFREYSKYQQLIYDAFCDEVAYLVSAFSDISLFAKLAVSAEKLLLTTPTTEIEYKKMKRFINSLKCKKLLREKTVDSLISFFDPAYKYTPKEQSKDPFRSSVHSAATKPTPLLSHNPVVSSPKITLETIEQRKEYLTTVFGLSSDAAKRYAHLHATENLEKMLVSLTNIVGEQYATGFFQANPAILRFHEQGVWNNYLRLLRVTQSRLEQYQENADVQQKFGLENNLREYVDMDRLQALKDALFAATKQMQASDDDEEEVQQNYLHQLTPEKLAKYSMLHQGIYAVEKRLEDIIEKGYVEVEETDHWKADMGRSKGARGINILKKIKYQLGGLSGVLHLPVLQQSEINYGQQKLSVSEEAREYLREIRDYVYDLKSQQRNGEVVQTSQ